MTDYTVSEPAFSESIKIWERTDPADALTMNITLQQLHQNTLYLLAQVQQAALGGCAYDADTQTLSYPVSGGSTGESTGGSSGSSAGGSYTLPAATAQTLGGIKVGENLTVSDDGTLSVDLSKLAQDKETANAIVDAGTTEIADEDLNRAYDDSKI